MRSDHSFSESLAPGVVIADRTPGNERQFEILEVLSADSDFSIVYRVRDFSRGDEAVLKEFFPHADVWRRPDGVTVAPRDGKSGPIIQEALRRFRQESDLLKEVRHPRVVRSRGSAFDANQTCYLAMDFVPGQTLRTLIEHISTSVRAPRPEAEWAEQLLGALLSAVEATHRHGVLHRDIKPANIIVSDAGLRGAPDALTLLDFGSAVRWQSASRGVKDEAPETSKSALKGRGAKTQLPFTAEYAPPEIASYEFLCEASDLYSVGATFFELLTGDKPLDAAFRQQYVLANRPDPQRQLASIPALRERYREEFLRALDRCLAIRVRERPASVAAVHDLLRPSEVIVEPPGTWARWRRKARSAVDGQRRGTAAFVLAMLAAVVGGVLLKTWWPTPAPPSQPSVAVDVPAADAAVTAPSTPAPEPQAEPPPDPLPVAGVLRVTVQPEDAAKVASISIDGAPYALGEAIELPAESPIDVRVVADGYLPAASVLSVFPGPETTDVVFQLCPSEFIEYETYQPPDRVETYWESVGTTTRVFDGACPESGGSSRRALADRACSLAFPGSKTKRSEPFEIGTGGDTRLVSGEVVRPLCEVTPRCHRELSRTVTPPPEKRLRRVPNNVCNAEPTVSHPEA
jgi:serine/threonine protein kinase